MDFPPQGTGINYIPFLECNSPDVKSCPGGGPHGLLMLS
jgi:hypothetical protein